MAKADVLREYLRVERCLRDIRSLVERGRLAHAHDDERALTRVKAPLKIQAQRLSDVWPDELPTINLSNLARHCDFSESKDYSDMSERDLPRLEAEIDEYLSKVETEHVGFSKLLHPKVSENCLRHYEDGDYREAVLNGMIALSHAIRDRVNIDLDGVDLVSDVFKPGDPRLIFSEVGTKSGRDDQEGFHLIMLGAFKGVRNPKAHELTSDLTKKTAAQYLVFISLLLRRVDEAKLRKRKVPGARDEARVARRR